MNDWQTRVRRHLRERGLDLPDAVVEELADHLEDAWEARSVAARRADDAGEFARRDAAARRRAWPWRAADRDAAAARARAGLRLARSADWAASCGTRCGCCAGRRPSPPPSSPSSPSASGPRRPPSSWSTRRCWRRSPTPTPIGWSWSGSTTSPAAGPATSSTPATTSRGRSAAPRSSPPASSRRRIGNLSGDGGAPEELRGVAVQPQVLGDARARARWSAGCSSKATSVPGAPPAILISEGLWQRRFGGAGRRHRPRRGDERRAGDHRRRAAGRLHAGRLPRRVLAAGRGPARGAHQLPRPQPDVDGQAAPRRVAGRRAAGTGGGVRRPRAGAPRVQHRLDPQRRAAARAARERDAAGAVGAVRRGRRRAADRVRQRRRAAAGARHRAAARDGGEGLARARGRCTWPGSCSSKRCCSSAPAARWARLLGAAADPRGLDDRPRGRRAAGHRRHARRRGAALRLRRPPRSPRWRAGSDRR